MIPGNSAFKHLSHNVVSQYNLFLTARRLGDRTKVFKFLITGVAVLGSLTPQLAWAQRDLNSYGSQGTGNYLRYPFGTRIAPNGRITTPNNGTLYPSNTIDNGNGTKTFYYRNGTRVILRKDKMKPGGVYLSPNSTNGGLRTTPNRALPPFKDLRNQ
ncbi:MULTISPECIES: hypothetical protein [Nostocales]|uniref:Uncharacterized protein n=3 Tax=Nostocales TaxID=1161 RepID=A0A0C1RDR8_9CYAN|nr:hypothetical protein [Tolypothrix bouteillei]KAF3886360.1 hypothetical protein DA73_0400013395 [Tolypothrix bouteillei VB521301]